MARMRFTADDERYMLQALRLAGRGRGAVEPNPMVGAVLVKAGRVLGRGYHRRYGEAHAEVNALRAAEKAHGAAAARGATMYVTLEPCCHYGKQPPCTEALLAAGVKRVVVALRDPFAQVAGKGIARLRRAGVKVDVGLLGDEARDVAAPFVKRVTTGMPWVIAKWAQSLDGAIATAAGESKWISSETSRAEVQRLRGRMDAIVVGLKTVLADDPLLMARVGDRRDLQRVATRVVFDSQCRMPVECQLTRTIAHAPVMVVHAAGLKGPAEKRRRKLEARGVLTVGVNADAAGRPSVPAFLKHLGEREYTNVLVEGGGELLGAFLHADAIDEARVYVAPLIIGGAHARRPIAGADLAQLAAALRMRLLAVADSGGDLELIVRR